jgi:ABC-type multidrug transport system fused ATPase/permease subunit
MAYLKLFKEMWRYAGGDRWKIVVFVIAHLLSHASTIGGPLVIAQVLNTLQKQPSHILQHILFWLLGYLGLFLWGAAFHRTGRYYEFQVEFGIYQRFMKQHYTIISELPLQWHTDHHSGDTINRLNKATSALREFTSSQYMYIEHFVTLVGPIIALSVLSWQISLIALIMSSLVMIVIRFYDGLIEKAYKKLMDLEHHLSSVIYDYIGNIKTVIILKLSRQTAAEVEHRIAVQYKPFMRGSAWLNGWKWFTVPLLDVLLTVIVIFVYIFQKISRNQGILIGNVSAINAYLQQLSGAFNNFAMHYQNIVTWNVAYEAAAPIRLALDQRIHAQLHAIETWQSLDIAGLNFSYSSARPVLNDLTLSFTTGEKIAFVGESGSGKSSLMGVLRGLYEPQSVNLTIDGKSFDILAPLAGITTLIPQEPEIFENTIRYNITFGVEHSEAEVLEAVRIARFDAVLERLPNGLETDVRERGVTLSGGERQRLALARGILAASDSSIILLDEPTSSVDAYNEALIYENIFARYPDRTIVASIHRLHMLGRFDRVVVMERGRIVQSGTFEALKAEDGVFKVLWEKAVE